MVPAIFTAICFALTAVSAQQSASLIGALRANLFRLLVAVFILGIISLLFWRGMPMTHAAEFAVAGGIGFGMAGYCVMQALKRLGSPQTLLIVESCTAVLAGILAWVTLEDTLTLPQMISCGIILGGVLFAGSSWIGESESISKKAYIQGYLFAGSASFFQAISLIISRHAFLEAKALDLHIDMFNAAFIRLLGGLVIAILFILVFSIRRKNKESFHPSSFFQLIFKGKPLRQQPLIWVFANALLGPVLGVTCWLWAVSLLNPGIVQSIAATAPLISIPLSRMLESHQLGPRFFVGAPVAIVGITALMIW